MRIYQLKEFVTVYDAIEYNDRCITEHLFNSTFLTSLTGYDNKFIQFLIDNLDYKASQLYELNRMDKLLNNLYSRLINHFIENPEPDASDPSKNLEPIVSSNKVIRDLVVSKYFANWEKLYKSLLADYNPINNYDMEEHEDNDVTTNVGTDTEFTNNETLKRNAFNTVTPSTVTETTGGGSNTGLKTKNEQSVVTDRTLTRSGNIGVTTSQQMIESEIQLRKRNLLDLFFIDLDKMLFLDYYI